jgi:hypothetical protein
MHGTFLLSHPVAFLTENRHTQGKILDEIRFIAQERREKRNATILDWLSPESDNMQIKQRDILSQRTRTTGGWLLEHADFKRWREQDSPPMLWCSGHPGTGKTILTSIVAENIGSDCVRNEIALAVIYCDYKNQENQTADKLLRSITRQLIQGRSSLFKPLENLFEDLTRRKAALMLKDCEALIQSVCNSFKEAYVVIDALDELGPDQRNIMLPVIRRIQQSSVKVLVTSRPHIERSFRNRTQIIIHATEADIRQYVTSKVEEHQGFLDVVDNDQELMDTVVCTIVGGADGMFLLASLQLQHVTEAPTKQHLKKALEAMPKDLFATYKEILTRIRKQGPSDQEFALRALGWICHAKRPLLVDELQHALGLEFRADKEPGKMLNQDNLISDNALSKCVWASS